MEGHIGEIFEGTITTLTNFGMFIALDNMVEGLVHINTLYDDYYSFYKYKLKSLKYLKQIKFN
jgi:ribonuclease R